MPQAPDIEAETSELGDEAQTIRLDPLNRIVEEAAERLRQAVKDGGGHGQVAKRSGIAGRTLSALIAGQEPKLSQLLAIAVSCNARLEWLALGIEPMRPLGELSLIDTERPASISHEMPAAMQDDDFEALLAGLDIAEDLQPHATPEARISAALRAARQIYRAAGNASPPPFDPHKLAACLHLTEQLSGRDRPARHRLATALGTYVVQLRAAAEPTPG